MMIQETDSNYRARIVAVMPQGEDQDLSFTTGPALDAIGERHGVFRRKLEGYATFEVGQVRGDATLRLRLYVGNEEVSAPVIFSGPAADLDDFIAGKITLAGIGQRWAAKRGRR